VNAHFRLAALLLAILPGVIEVRAQIPAAASSNANAAALTNATLEELMNIQVTSVSKKEESLSKTDAAIFDTRFGWTPKPRLELSVAGQNLLTPLHAEFHNAYELRRTLIERSIYGKITWRF